jgi:Uma2 family endonuclease
MTAVTAPPRNPDAERPFTVEDLAGMPDDGRRYELLDGVLVVSPAPGTKHQKAVARLIAILDAVCPADMHVLPSPFAVRTSPENELQPDLLVARDEDLAEKLLPVAPMLAVEVLSPSTALNDLNNKKAAYQRMGVPSYWVIDPREPRLTVFELTEAGQYEQVADVKDEDGFEARWPFPVRVVPAQLLGGLRGRFD